jgi:large subunit ribosomal protein L13
MKTHIATQEEIKNTHKFYVVDAGDVILGRLATNVARLLSGKHKPIYTPFLDTGDHVIIVNAEKVRLTGNKLSDKKMIHHSRYPGGLKVKDYDWLVKNKPEKVIMEAVWGMLPKTRLGRQMLKKLRVYRGSEHPHTANQPEAYEIKA